ncbi:MAG TPA: SRPBCC domain-containing protein [Burkholderiales bacterium]|nr:SRPBCC domain-containing protein [Burkholderiales bacterium]
MKKIEPFVISRVFDAPRDRVWKAWTEVERLKQWFSPKGCTVIAAKMDLRPGGTYHYGMRTPDGHEMWGKWTFREIEAPQRLVLVNCFSDAAGGITRHPMAPTWPLEMLSTTTFAEQGGKTTLTLEWLPINASPEEIATFEAGRAGMTQGWGGTMEQFTAYLAKT